MVLDLGHLAKSANLPGVPSDYRKISLSLLCELVLRKNLMKPHMVRCSYKPLNGKAYTHAQLEYAASDAICSLQIYQELVEKYLPQYFSPIDRKDITEGCLVLLVSPTGRHSHKNQLLKVATATVVKLSSGNFEWNAKKSKGKIEAIVRINPDDEIFIKSYKIDGYGMSSVFLIFC